MRTFAHAASFDPNFPTCPSFGISRETQNAAHAGARRMPKVDSFNSIAYGNANFKLANFCMCVYARRFPLWGRSSQDSMQAEAGTGARSSGEAQGVAQRGEQRCRMNGLGEQYEVMIFGAGRFDEVRRRRLPEKS